MKKLTIAVVAIAIVCLGGLQTLGAPTKERAWQEGKLLDIVNDPYTQGSIWAGTNGAIHKERITYIIDAEKYVYTASHLHFRHDKAMPVTVNATVKFAIEKNKVYILDEENKEHELKFEKRTLKDTAKDK